MSRFVDIEPIVTEAHRKGVSLVTLKLLEVNATADVVEVVRCKDCKYKDTCCRMIRNEKKPSDFCSFGERREDDKE